MNKTLQKKVLIVILLLIILLMAYSLINIYAIFYSEAVANVVQENATWKIIVNGTNIATNNKFNVNTFEIEENTHVAEGMIAPSVTGSFFIEIVPQDTDVSIKYDIKLDSSNLINKQIKIVSIEEINNNRELVLTAENTYTGVLKLEDIKNGIVDKIKVTIEWENDDNNNSQDTLIGSTPNNNMDIPVSVHALQYLGEEIKQYNP